jgi:hypothetical protein
MNIDKFTYWLILGLFGMIVFLAIIECTLKHTKVKPSRKNLSIAICLVVLITVYTILFKFFHGDSWIGDYINSFVAMGTIGAVIISLYLANRKMPRSSYLELYSLQIKIYKANTNSVAIILHQIQNNSPIDITINKISVCSNNFAIATFSTPIQIEAHKLIKEKGIMCTNGGGALSNTHVLFSANTSNVHIVFETDVYDFKFYPKEVKNGRIRQGENEQDIAENGIKILTF